jgi:hypothetical protein
MARGRPRDRQASWCVGSEAPPEAKTLAEAGRRVAIAEHFLDDTSKGVHLEASLSRSATALERLCGVLAITPLSLVSQGTAVDNQGKRRWGDAPWLRGQSSLTIGWNGVKLALSRGYELMTSLRLSGEADPAPAMASKIQQQHQRQLCFAMEFQDAVACSSGVLSVNQLPTLKGTRRRHVLRAKATDATIICH